MDLNPTDFRVNDPTDPVYQELINSEVAYIISYYYLSVPVKLSGTFGKGKVKFLASLGVEPAYNFYCNQHYTSTYKGEKTNKFSDFKPEKHINLFAEAGAGIELKIRETASLRILPHFNMGILPIDGATVKKWRLFQAGISVGLYWGK